RKATIQFGSLNINGFGNLLRDHPDNKWGKLYRVMSEHRIGILFLQETHLTDERVASIHSMFARKIRVFHSANPDAPTQRDGVAIVLNSRYVSTKEAKAVEIVPGKAIQLTLTCQGGDIKSFLCIYAPTSTGTTDRKRFFEEVCKYYDEHPECPRPQLMAGDFNNVEDALDRLPIGEGPDQSTVALDELKMSLGLMLGDGWRVTNPTAREYTFHRGTGRSAVFSRLDRIYVTQNVFDNAREWRSCEAGVRTDHSLVLVQLTPDNAPVIGPGRPLFPVHLLKDRKLARQIKERGIQALRELDALGDAGDPTGRMNPQRLLEDFKTAAMKLAREREKEIVPRLLAEIREREQALKRVKANRNMQEEKRLAEAEALTKQIRELKQRRYKQQQQGSRATHRLQGELPTKYWTRLHRECAPRDIISAFEREDTLGVAGEKIFESDSKRMAEMARVHHMNVQRDEADAKGKQEREKDIETALDSLDSPVTAMQAGELGSEITYEECLLALRFAKNGTSPGLDGIPSELWKALHARHVEDIRFPERTNFDVVRLIRAAFQDVQGQGVDTRTSFAHGWIAPIYKEKGARTRVVNYRPITLLNTDYKLLSKILAVRL
ncbi:DNase I-like protein, partial [Polyporus arcularius HHB13444]